MFDFLFKSHHHRHRWLPGFIYVFAGSFIIASGWSWYHFYRQPRILFIGKATLVWLSVALAFFLAKYIYLKTVRLTKRHVFWQETFFYNFNELFFYSSLLFIIFFIEVELVSLVFTLLLLPFLFWKVQKAISHHPGGAPWLSANRSIFILTYLIFCFEAALQYAAYRYYILDSNIKFFNIVLFRSFAMTMFWILGFVLANHWYQRFNGILKYFVPILWVILFTFALILWTINLAILYYSGLYFSPIVLEHLSGSGGVVINSNTLYLIVGAVIIYIIFLVVFSKTLNTHRRIGRRYSAFYNYSIGAAALLVILTLSSFKNTPEHALVKSFYRYYFGVDTQRTLDLSMQKKLSRFGLVYEPEQFYVNVKSEVFSPTTTILLPEKFKKNRPNIIVVELESFSSRLTNVYNNKFPGLTPGLESFAGDPHSTIFYNYYNASTPTITGTLSQYCSFLPPTGHNEIQNDRKLQNHHLLCLPKILKQSGGYKYTSYITAVDKEFAHKDGIFTSMGVDRIFGIKELSKYIEGEPLSWGYSDHQLFPALWDFVQTAPEPFFMTLATVDTHPPFNLAKDAVNYGDGSQPVLNMFHTTDDAFLKFWQKFKISKFYQNTIVIAVADHAIFPGALTKDLFPEKAKELTYYDENFFVAYIPDNVLPKKISTYSSGIDFAPTLLQILNINVENSFEGHSIFDDRSRYPNVLGMHELGLYINQVDINGNRNILYGIPSEINCPSNYSSSSSSLFSLCDYLHFYEWKRQIFEQGRFWKY